MRSCSEAEKIRAEVRDDIAVRHPHGRDLGDMGQDWIGLVDLKARSPKLAMGRGRDGPAEDLAGNLHAVTDSQYRHAELEDASLRQRGILLIGAGVAAAQDDPADAARAKFVGRDICREDQGMDVMIAYAAGDQLQILRAEVKDGDRLTGHDQRGKRQSVKKSKQQTSEMTKARRHD